MNTQHGRRSAQRDYIAWYDAQGFHGGDRRSEKFQMGGTAHLNDEPGHNIRKRWHKLLDPAIFEHALGDTHLERTGLVQVHVRVNLKLLAAPLWLGSFKFAPPGATVCWDRGSAQTYFRPETSCWRPTPVRSRGSRGDRFAQPRRVRRRAARSISLV
jgi:hypothetical protein